MIGWIRDKLFGWAQRLRFPWLLLLTAALFGIDLAIPDFIPFIDEIFLGLTTLVLSRLRVPRADKPATPPM